MQYRLFQLERNDIRCLKIIDRSERKFYGERLILLAGNKILILDTAKDAATKSQCKKALACQLSEVLLRNYLHQYSIESD